MSIISLKSEQPRKVEIMSHINVDGITMVPDPAKQMTLRLSRIGALGIDALCIVFLRSFDCRIGRGMPFYGSFTAVSRNHNVALLRPWDDVNMRLDSPVITVGNWESEPFIYFPTEKLHMHQ